MNFITFISLFVAIAYAQTPQVSEMLVMVDAPPVLIAIAECESKTQQFLANGLLVRDYLTGDHVGLFQISQKIHSKRALSMGWNVDSAEGNISYALWLYKKQGTQPWISSYDCWGKNFTKKGVPRSA